MEFDLFILYDAQTSGHDKTSTEFGSRREVIVRGWLAELQMMRHIRLCVSCPELYIRGAIHQLAQDPTH